MIEHFGSDQKETNPFLPENISLTKSVVQVSNKNISNEESAYTPTLQQQQEQQQQQQQQQQLDNTESPNIEGSGEILNQNEKSSDQLEYSGSGDAVVDLVNLSTWDSPLLPNPSVDDSLVDVDVTTEKEEIATTIDQV